MSVTVWDDTLLGTCCVQLQATGGVSAHSVGGNMPHVPLHDWHFGLPSSESMSVALLSQPTQGRVHPLHRSVEEVLKLQSGLSIILLHVVTSSFLA